MYYPKWELQRVFLKTAHGFVPLVFLDSYVAIRTWQVFMDCVGATERQIMKEAALSRQIKEGIWKRNGSLLTEGNVYDWIHTGCQSVVSIENVLALNPGVECEVTLTKRYTGAKRKMSIKTTTDLDKCIDKMKDKIFSLSFSNSNRLILPDGDPLYNPNRRFALKIPHWSNYYIYGMVLKTVGDEEHAAFLRGAGFCQLFNENQATDIAITYERFGHDPVTFELISEDNTKAIIAVPHIFENKRYGEYFLTDVGFTTSDVKYARIFDTYEKAEEYIQEKVQNNDKEFIDQEPFIVRLPG